jgi:uncharacterized protein with PIN domain
MIDRERLLKALEFCRDNANCGGCPYDRECGTRDNAIEDDTIAFLREQEPVEPDGDNCVECGYTLHRINYDGPDKKLRHEWFRFCPSCGKAAKWDE